MNINELTIGQARELMSMFGESNKPNMYERYIGKAVLVRSRNEGVNFGFVVAADETGIVLRDARRLWLHKPADPNQCWYEGVANSGLSDDSKISPMAKEKAIVENYSITICSDAASKSIQEKRSHEQ